ncbi:MAG: TolB family protein [Nannocystaceae bacterium]
MNLQRVLSAVLVSLGPTCVACTSQPPSSADPVAKPGAPATQPTQAAASPAPAPKLPPGTVVFVSERDGNPELYAVGSDGSGLQRLTNEPGGNYPGPIAPSADRLLMLVSHDDAAGHREQMNLRIWSNGKAGPGRPLGPLTGKVRNPVWAADGSALVFESNAQSFRDLYRVETAPGSPAPTRLTDNREGNFEPSIRHDGRVVFVSSREGSPMIFSMAADGSDVQRLTGPPAHCSAPKWSPDGSMIAFVRSGPRSSELHVMRADGSEQRPLRQTPSGDGTDREYTWSPSGQSIALTHIGKDSTVVSRIDLKRGLEVVLSDPEELAQQPAWMGSDAYLMWSATREGNADLFASELATGYRVQLTHHSAPDWLPRWLGPGSPNDRPTPAQPQPSGP